MPTIARRIGFWALAGAALLLGAGALAVGPLAAPLVEALADGRKVWRLGRLEVAGVSGPLWNLRARDLSIADAEGVWLTAEDVALRWRPFALLQGGAVIDAVAVARAGVLRRPTLSAPPPDEGRAVDLVLNDARVAALVVSEGVAGEAATYALSLGLALQDEAVTRARIDMRRLDGGEDLLTARYEAEPMTLAARLIGPEGGFFAALAGAPIELTAEGVGPTVAVEGAVGGAPALDLDLAWTKTAWTLEGSVEIGAIPALDALAARIGAGVVVSASGGRPGQGTAAFAASAAAPRVTLEAQGRLGAGLALVGPVSLQARAQAEALSLNGGVVAFAGAVETGDKLGLDGMLRLTGVGAGDLRVSGAGPIEALADNESIRFEAALADLQVAAQSPILRRALSGADFVAVGAYDRQDGALALSRLSLRDSALTLQARGAAFGATPRLQGAWGIADLGVLDPAYSGRAGGDFTLQQAQDAPWRLDLNGRAQRVGGLPEPLRDLVGREARLEAGLSFPEGFVQVERATIEARQLRAGVWGRLGDTADLALEASARGPVRIGGAAIDGVVDAVGRVSGRLDAPAISATARLDSIEAAGLSAARAEVRLDLEPVREGRLAGTTRLDGLVQGRPLAATAQVALDDGIRFDGIDAAYAGFDAKGAAAFTALGPQAALSLSGRLETILADASGAVAGELRLAPGPGDRPVIAAELVAAQARLPQGLRLTRASAVIEGPLDAFAVQASAQGAVRDGRPFSLAARGTAAPDEGGFRLTSTLDGRIGDTAVSTRSPIVFAIAGAATTAQGALAVGTGEAAFSWRAGPQGVAGEATLRALPVAPFAALAGEAAEGRLTGQASLAGRGARLDGAVDLAAEDLRLRDRSEQPLSARLTGRLANDRFEGELVARSAAGLTAALDGRLDLVATASPLRIARDPSGSGAAAWTIAGPIDGLWDVVGPLDQRLTGRVDGSGEVRLSGGGDVSGSGAIMLADGRFEDAVTGVSMSAIDARVAFDQAGLTLERFNATDGRGGRITGQGRLLGQNQGELALTLTRFRLVDREDVSATGSGRVALTLRPEGAALTGRVQLDQAEAAPPQSRAAVPTIDVIEINRPEGDPEPDPPIRSRALPVSLDLQIVAPNRVFTRTRGVDAEWSLNLDVQGDVATPRLFGRADLLRGTFDLAGRRFDLSEGRVRFDGAIENSELRIVAVRDTPDLTVRIVIDGAVEDPQIALTSTPALPEDEILPQALFGRDAAELSALEAAQLAASLAALAGQSAFDIAGAARDIAALDRLEVREADGGIYLAGGRYLTQVVYLEVARGPAGETTTSVEWQVRPRFYLISTFGALGEQRLAIRWRRDY